MLKFVVDVRNLRRNTVVGLGLVSRRVGAQYRTAVLFSPRAADVVVHVSVVQLDAAAGPLRQGADSDGAVG